MKGSLRNQLDRREMRWFTVGQIAAINLSEKGISHHICSNHVREVWMMIWIFIFDLDSSNVNKCRQTVVLFKETQKANVVQVIVNGKDGRSTAGPSQLFGGKRSFRKDGRFTAGSSQFCGNFLKVLSEREK
uniref:Uncharacterized protein n=1 Tax=Rhizophagus irregularis (strain DAOM 181602 / DAOM 197198 / MUCL 43194) TaxID=747089 RepID=U9UD29_RHIID